MAAKKNTQPTKFLNVDLDLHAKYGLDILLKALKPNVITLNYDKIGFASVEALKQPKSIDSAILAYFRMIQALPPRARTVWENCEKRTMNIGIYAGQTPHQKYFCLSEKTISRLLSLRATVVFTVYSKE